MIVAALGYLTGLQNVASAATYYLNTTSGNDSNPGTLSAPWKTLARVQAGTGSGDTVILQSADAATYAAPWPAQVSFRAKVLQQFAVTWTFDTDYPVGQFANGDFWVVGPVKIVGINPPSVPSNGRTMNGSVVNPPAGYYSQGYDSAMPAIAYDASMNVALGVSAGSPPVLAAHSSLISTISDPTAGAIPQMLRAVVLTVLPSPAAPNSFRPPYCGTDKTIRFNKSALDYSLLQKLAPVTGTPALTDVEAQFAAPWLEHAGGWGATALRPKLNMPNYGREMHTAIGTAALMLHLNFSDQQKEKLLVEFVQLGIDFYGVIAAGGTANWAADGGHSGGRKWPILCAGLMLNDPAMKAIGAKSGDYLFQNGYGPGHCPPDYIRFGEDDQTAYVTQADVDITHGPTWKPDSRDPQDIPYETTDIGLPEWGIRHAANPELNNKWLPTEYRGVAGPPFHGTALAALLMTGAKALWNHPAYFDYTDRYMAFTAPGGEYAGWWRSMSGFTANMWDTYRAQLGPVWPATGSAGPTLAPIADQQITTGQTLTLIVKGTGPSVTDLTYSASGLPTGATFSGQTFTWTPTAAQVGVYPVTFTVSDGKYQDSKTITITVIKANSAPVLGAIGDKSINENQTLTFTVSATDADGTPLTYGASNLPAGAGFAGQTFSWTPAYNQAGSYNVTFTASDGQVQDSQTIALTVANVDRPPVLAPLGNQSVTAGSPLSFPLSATDPDGDSLTYSAGTLPSGATLTGSTFTWTPAAGQVGTYTIAFAASDGTLSDSETMTVTVTGSTASQDRTAPAVAQCTPAPNAIQVSLNNVVTLHVTDTGSGVNTGSVVIRVNGNVVYQGNTNAYASAYGQCSRNGPKSDYRFLYQPKTPFDFDQVVAVSVDAADAAGNVMNTYQYAFTTQMLAFGKNAPVDAVGLSSDGRPVTACDPAGTMWVAWHSGAVNGRDIYVAKRPAGANSFQTPIRLTSDPRDQCNPALAIGATGVVYVVWQDNRSGNWDIYLATCSNGSTFSPAVRVTSSPRNETSPAVAVDRQAPANVYVAWQDDRSGSQDIYLARSTTSFATSTVWQVTNHPADQKQPRVAVDGSNIAYVFWTDMRNGPADIYGAASNAGPWSNVPIVTDPGDQTQPAVAAASDALHLVWVDNRSGNNDIYYACLNGLPASPVSGVDIVDDTSGANQTAPAIVCGTTGGGVPRVFACWQDARHPDTDVYAVELRSGKAEANIFVGDDGTNTNQGDPAIGMDRYGQPYLVWADSRRTAPRIYSAATTLIDPTPVSAKTVVAAAGACLGTDPAAIQGTQDVSLVVPPGACPADLNMSISKILNPPVSGDVLLGSYEFGPSGVDFNQPVTVTIPYATAAGSSGHALPYWYDSVTGALSQQGITDVRNVVLSSSLSALRFRTTHFTPFYLIEADTPSPAPTGAGGGGCALASDGDGSPGQLLVPYAAIALIMVILRHRDKRRGSPTRRVALGDPNRLLAPSITP